MKYKLFITLVASLAVFGVSSVSAAGSVDDSCRTVEAVYARGSGETKLISSGLSMFRDRLSDYFNNSALHLYELGTDTYDGHNYGAVAVGIGNLGTTIGAWVTAGSGGAYGDSVNSGMLELQSYLSQRSAKCPGSYFVLGGYSQGAQAVGQVLPLLSQSVRDRVVFVGLFGDPKLDLPEGVGIMPPACSGENLSAYRRDIGSCHVFRGSLGARIPYLPNDFLSKTGLWCYRDDFVCGSSINPFNTSGHGLYGDDGMAISDAVSEAAWRLQPLLPADEADYIDMVNREHTNLRGHDFALMVDPAMLNEITLSSIKQQVSSLANNIVSRQGRVALVESYNQSSIIGDSSSAVALSDFADGIIGFQAGLNTISVIDRTQIASGDQLLHGISDTMGDIDWGQGSTRALYYLTGGRVNRGWSPNQDLQAAVIKQARANGAVAVSAVASRYGVDGQVLANVVDSTGGIFYDNVPVVPQLAPAINSVSSDDESIDSEVFSQITDDINTRPVFKLPIDEYSTIPGGSVHFSLSGQNLDAVTVYEYQWDYDDDGMVDEVTNSPDIDHTYPDTFSGYMSVRVVTSVGDVVATASVHIADAPVVVVPQSPSSLKLVVNSTDDNHSSVTISWIAPRDLPDHYVLALNGVALGILPNNRTSVEIRDISRDYDNEISVNGADDSDNMGDPAVVTLDKLSADSEAPTQPNPPSETGPKHSKKTILQLVLKIVKFVLKIIFH